MNEDVPESHLFNNKDSGNRRDPQNRHESVCARPTASMIYPIYGTGRQMDACSMWIPS
jgi:hypothetical protein